ncbi:MAG: DEAD/DEAH box helicase, partial [Kribbellaceae bacterium]|nr:DEAD/DEAH box helicase [Kribbellaceae bacterium]
MDDVNDAGAPKRGRSASRMREFACKDCRREVEGLQDQIAALERRGAGKNELRKLRAVLRTRMENATYNENWARNLVERGGSRSDRCKEHRLQHRVDIQGLAVAYIDLQTVGEVADRDNPTGPLGGLGPLPTLHKEVEGTSYDLQHVQVGMTDAQVAEMIDKLREKQVLILKAGTGTGKSTFAPYRLMDPPPSTLAAVPPGAPFAKLTELGPIIVTEPRVQAAIGVASFVGSVLSGAGGVGPGYPVGYQVSGDRNHDEACELVYVTDGTMINWLREGRLSRIGTVIVDEAHERSTNIDIILGYLKRELPRYPHLRVIVTSATFNPDFYLEYFGGPANAAVLEVPPEKTFGYGMPLFPNLDTPDPGEDDVLERWTDPALPLTTQNPRDEQAFIRAHWKAQFAEPLLYPDDVAHRSDDGYTEDVWATTRLLTGLRFEGKIPVEQWPERMPGELAKFVIRLARGLDEAGIFGDILGFLPTRRTIEPVCEEIERALGRTYKDHVFPLIASLPKDRQRRALAKRRLGDPRKIVISTNLAETSLTVEGVRFVVDSGIIAQSEWDPELARGIIPTKPHSQAGIKQRWGRVGRKAPGWVFPLYTKAQFLELAEDTPPGSTRDNLEALVMTAKTGGIDDVLDFEWPAAFQPTTVELDEQATQAREVFVKEIRRADLALRAGGAVDDDGHPTSFGRELVRFQGLGSTASALAIMYADRLACVPEVATVIALLEDTRLIGSRGLLLDDFDWPDDWRLEAAERHRGFASLCTDDAELVLLIAAAWESADASRPPWEDSPVRQDWARAWWVNHAVLLEAAQRRQDVLAALSPAMKEDAKRFLEPALIDRTRGVLTRVLAANIFTKTSDGEYRQTLAEGSTATSRTFVLEEDCLVQPPGEQVVALRRRESKYDNRISSLVAAQKWALPRPGEQHPSNVDALQLVVAASKYAPADAAKNERLRYLAGWPVGRRVRLELDVSGATTTARLTAEPVCPFPRPKTRAERGVDAKRGRTNRAPARGRLPVDGDEVTGSAEDVETEIRVAPRRGYDDEGQLQAELLEADRDTGVVQGCGQCFPCRDDRPEDCERQGGPAEPGPREDLLAGWRAQAGVDIANPRVEIDHEVPVQSEGWYEVTGYAQDELGVTVKLRPDWRRGQTSNAGQHPDLKPGDPIDVRVGQLLRHHGGALRAFDRVDGHGRFILAEARSRYPDEQIRRREIAVSLDRGNATLLKNLVTGSVIKATAVPARAEGTLTITLLELLHQHWSKAQDGRGASNEVLERRGRNHRHERVYTAVVDVPANANGYVTAALLHQDGQLGIVHRFDFNATPRQQQRAESA